MIEKVFYTINEKLIRLTGSDEINAAKGWSFLKFQKLWIHFPTGITYDPRSRRIRSHDGKDL